MDILEVLAEARKLQENDEIDIYIMNALTGGLLDSKCKKRVETFLT
jgi:hypothetical protein